MVRGLDRPMMEVWRRKKRSFELEKGKSGERENSDGAGFRAGKSTTSCLKPSLYNALASKLSLKLSIKYRQDTSIARTHSPHTRP